MRRGAMSSWRVQPRVNHLDVRKGEPGALSAENGESGTSARYTKHMSVSRYHAYIELIASDSSELLDLSMQHESIQM